MSVNYLKIFILNYKLSQGLDSFKESSYLSIFDDFFKVSAISSKPKKTFFLNLSMLKINFPPL